MTYMTKIVCINSYISKFHFVIMLVIAMITLVFIKKKDPCYHYAPIINQITRDRFMEMAKISKLCRKFDISTTRIDEYDPLAMWDQC